MILLHQISSHKHSNCATLKQILECTEPLSFDGVYASVYEHRDALKHRLPILFVVGGKVGEDNLFDDGRAFEDVFLTWKELEEMQDLGFELGWHTWTHPDLTKLPYDKIVEEVTPPFPMRYFAYPHGLYNDDVVRAVKEAGFEDAWSVTQGTGEQFKRKRRYL